MPNATQATRHNKCMAFSIREAADITNKSTDTIRRAIRAKKLVATLDPHTGYQIERADLEAWAGRPTVEATHNNQADRLALALAEVQRLRNEADKAQAVIEAQAANLNDLRNQVANLNNQVTTYAIALVRMTEATKRRGLFGRREKARELGE